MDPRTPVVVGVAQLHATTHPNEPIGIMAEVAEAAMVDAGGSIRTSIGSVRVVRGINPYRNPGRLVADELGFGSVETGLTQHGGQEAYDLVARTCDDIAAGAVDAAIVCGAETMRTRRKDRAAGRRSDYLDEANGVAPDVEFGSVAPYWDDLDTAAQANVAVNFYAMAETARRHRLGETPATHLDRISTLWAAAAEVAATNPHAAVRTSPDAAQIGTAHERNRLVADPYPKLMTSNVNVDMGAAIVLCSAGAATAAGVPSDRWVLPLGASSAHDHWQLRSRWELDKSPAMRIGGHALLDRLAASIDDFDHVDLYSCFPIAVQVAQEAFGQDPAAAFTITGGLTFNGGPFNTYCLHPLVTAVDRIRADGGRAFLSGNGGFFTKHAFLALGNEPADGGFVRLRPQADVDALPSRPVTTATPDHGTVESHTTVFARDGEPHHSIVSVLGPDGSRSWAHVTDPDEIAGVRAADSIGRTARLHPSDTVTPLAHLA